MGINFGVSKETHISRSIIRLFATLTVIATLFSGVVSASESDLARQRENIAAARNALDSTILQPGMKLDDPRVKEKTKELQDQMDGYQKAFNDSQKPAERPKVYPRAFPGRAESDGATENQNVNTSSTPSANPLPPRTEVPAPGPETVIDGSDVKKEITYAKKPTPGKTERPIPKLHAPLESVEEPIPENTSKPNAAGLSEIQYSKKKSAPKPVPTDSAD
jgi:hypothetical protein